MCPFSPVAEGITERLARYAAAVPDDVELGFHLGYGDYKNEHLIQPEDCRTCVAIFNPVAEAIERRIDWVHIPVPIERDDDTYFAPSTSCASRPRPSSTWGWCITATAARELNVASRRPSGMPAPSVSPPRCGMGHRPPERGGGPLLRPHADVSGAVR